MFQRLLFGRLLGHTSFWSSIWINQRTGYLPPVDEQGLPKLHFSWFLEEYLDDVLVFKTREDQKQSLKRVYARLRERMSAKNELRLLKNPTQVATIEKPNS